MDAVSEEIAGRSDSVFRRLGNSLTKNLLLK